MILTCDFHTHTRFSHGKGSILDNALVAKEKGLLAIAITDHGYGHRTYGISHKKVPYMKELCREAEAAMFRTRKDKNRARATRA